MLLNEQWSPTGNASPRLASMAPVHGWHRDYEDSANGAYHRYQIEMNLIPGTTERQSYADREDLRGQRPS